MGRYYVEIATKGQVVFSNTVAADTEAEAFDRTWEAFDPAGKIDFLDTSHNAWMKQV